MNERTELPIASLVGDVQGMTMYFNSQSAMCLPEDGEGSSLRAGLAGINPSTLSSLIPPGEWRADGVGPSTWLSSSVLHNIYTYM